MPMKILNYIDKSVIKQMKFTECLYYKMGLYDWLNKFYNFYMAAVVGIVGRHDLTMKRVVPNKINLALYKLLLSL